MSAVVTKSYEEIYFEIWSRVQIGELTTKHLLWFLDLPKTELDRLAGVSQRSYAPDEPDLRLPLSDARGVIPIPQIPIRGADELLASFGVPARPSEKFALYADLGVLTVPDDYDHATCLSRLHHKDTICLGGYANDIVDEHYQNPTRIMRAGERFHVRVFRQVSADTTTIMQRIAFLESQNALHVGVQGLVLVCEQKIQALPCEDGWYASYDVPERLWGTDSGMIPTLLWMFLDVSGNIFFETTIADLALDREYMLLCFTEVE